MEIISDLNQRIFLSLLEAWDSRDRLDKLTNLTLWEDLERDLVSQSHPCCILPVVAKVTRNLGFPEFFFFSKLAPGITQLLAN